MVKPPASFALEHFVSVSESHPDREKRGVNDVEGLASSVHDAGTVKIGQGGGKPFARHPAIHDTGKVRFGEGGSLPFARYHSVNRTTKVKIGSGGGAPFARY